MVQVALFLAALLCFLLGLTVLLNNPRVNAFRVYFLLSIVSASWMLVNGLVVASPVRLPDAALLVISQLITPLSLLTTLSFAFFIAQFMRLPLKSRWSWFIVLPTLVVSLFSFTSLNVYLTPGGDIHTGALYPFYLLTLLCNTLLVFVLLYMRQKHSTLRTNSQHIAQLKYIRLGTYLTFVPAILLGAILPIFSSSPLTNISPLFSVAFLVTAGVAIVKHRLFDIRWVIARSLTYALSLGVIALLFIVASYLVTAIPLPGGALTENQLRAIYSVLAVVLALLLPSIRTFFDKNTNRLFYRDAYDSQAFLDSFNKLLVSTYNFGALLHRSAVKIEETIKPAFCAFAIFATPNTPRKVIGSGAVPTFSREDLMLLEKAIFSSRSSIIVTYDLSDKYRDLQTMLQNKGIALVARLLSPKKGDDEIGFLMLGTKKSGNMYTAEDIRLINIISNELALAVQNSLRFEQIENFNATLQAKVTEATRKLRRTNETLKALDETKDDFVSMASHQLRTPLTSVKGYLSMVLEGDAGKINATQRRLLEQSFVSSQRMVYLIADLLNVSRLKTGKFVIEETSVNLAEVVQQEIGQLTAEAASRQLTLTYVRPDNFPLLLLDETKTRQIIMNFVDNAIYYTPAGGSIAVKLIETPVSVELRVVDTGIGVPKHERQHLFTKFYRANNARKARPDGTGLGLFMAKKVIVAQGGAIIFESEEGKGSTFGFVFSKSKTVPNTPVTLQ